jgi:AcrR family transcriptional regulator
MTAAPSEEISSLRAALQARISGVRPEETDGRRRRKLEVRHRILLAAAELFAEQGLGRTKVAEICERADVAHKTFFNHFPSRRHVIRALAEEAMRVLLADIETIRKQPASTAGRLHRFFEQLAENLEAWGPMHRELVTEFVHVAHETRTGEEKARKLADAFGALVRDGRAQGDVTRRHAEATLTEMVLGAFYALMFGWANLEGYPFRTRALAAGRFLGEALAPAPGETKR